MSISLSRKCDNCQIDTTLTWCCCNPVQKFCISCSKFKCKRCGFPRNKYHLSNKKRTVPACCICRNVQILEIQQFFFDDKCKFYYCHHCLLLMYEEYEKTTKTLHEIYGNQVQLQVEIYCHCQIQRKVILEYLQQYCMHCSNRVITGRIQLKNECVINKMCLLQLIAESKKKPHKVQTEEFLKKIQSLFISCDLCNQIMDGYNRKIVKELDGLQFCDLCLSNIQLRENLYQQLQKQKRKSLQDNLVSREDMDRRAEIVLNQGKIQQKKQEEKHFVNSEINQLHSNKYSRKSFTKIRQKLAMRAQPNKTNDIKKQIQQKISMINQFEIEHELKMKDYVNIPQKDVKNEQLNHMKSSKIEKNIKQTSKSSLTSENKSLSGKQLEMVIKFIEQKNQQDPKCQPINIKSAKANNISEENQEQLLQFLNEIPLKRHEKASHNEQFYPLQTIKLQIKKVKLFSIECRKCNYLLQQNSYFKAFQRQPGNEKTLRIVETQQQLLRYGNQKRIQYFCKACYFLLKANSLKEKQQRKKYRSVPKKQENVDRFSGAITLTRRKKSSQLQKLEDLQSKDIEFANKKGKNHFFLQICLQCKKRVSLNKFDVRNQACNICVNNSQNKRIELQKAFSRQCIQCKAIYQMTFADSNQESLCKQCRNLKSSAKQSPKSFDQKCANCSTVFRQILSDYKKAPICDKCRMTLLKK